METLKPGFRKTKPQVKAFNFLASLINGNDKPTPEPQMFPIAFNFLASLINGNHRKIDAS